MKLYILALILLAGSHTFAQDSTTVKNIQLQARLIEYLAPLMTSPENDSLYTTFLGLRTKFRVQTPPTGTAYVTLDSIPTVELANLYNYCLSNSDGMLQGIIMKPQIAAARTANTYLERLCAAHEAFWIDRLFLLRTAGRKLLRGK